MILVNNKLVKQEAFGDKTLKCEIPETIKKSVLDFNFFGAGTKSYHIVWCYDNDSELFLLQCIVDEIRDIEPTAIISLKMPYIPNARQDRRVSNRFFTLKSFCKIINNMNFEYVSVLDPHSDVSTALLDRVSTMDVNLFVDSIILPYDTIMFPDLGSSKKYGYLNIVKNHKVIVGNKVRNWSTGSIKSLEIIGDIEDVKDKDILIVDDVCSFGSTYFFAGQKLKEMGARNVYLYVSHCEDSVYKGKLIEQGSPIDVIITTDSLLSEEHNQVRIIRNFREVKV